MLLKPGQAEIAPSKLIMPLRGHNLLPAIVFLPTRRRCDEAAMEVSLAEKGARVPTAKEEKRKQLLDEFTAGNPEIAGHKHRRMIVRGGVAAHHAGHIPAWKLLIEKMMSAGLLDAIFATATVAAGVDFPARTVVVTVADRRSASGWQSLTASELQQMSGRAGRRGKDRVGFIVAAPGPHQNPQSIVNLLNAPPDDLESQFRATYTSLLNLLDAFKNFAQVREIAEQSFAHRKFLPRMRQLERVRVASEQRIREALTSARAGVSVEVVRGLERLASARSRLFEGTPQTRRELVMDWLRKVVQPGRVIGIGRSGKRLVIVTARSLDGVTGVREHGRTASFPLERIGRVFSPVFSTHEDWIDEAFDEIHQRGRELALREPRLSDANADEAHSQKLINDLIDSFMRTGANEGEAGRLAELLWSLQPEAGELQRADRQIESLRAEVWEPFERCARVLNHFGYLDFAREQVTERGCWLADLHVDRPLLIGETLQRGIFKSLDARRTAALVAAMARGEGPDHGEVEAGDEIVDLLARFEQVAFDISTEEWSQGIEGTAEINFSDEGG